jgi:hypothetical protein
MTFYLFLRILFAARSLSLILISADVAHFSEFSLAVLYQRALLFLKSLGFDANKDYYTRPQQQSAAAPNQDERASLIQDDSSADETKPKLNDDGIEALNQLLGALQSSNNTVESLEKLDRRFSRLFSEWNRISAMLFNLLGSLAPPGDGADLERQVRKVRQEALPALPPANVSMSGNFCNCCNSCSIL